MYLWVPAIAVPVNFAWLNIIASDIGCSNNQILASSLFRVD
jgi:hypothetical protein